MRPLTIRILSGMLLLAAAGCSARQIVPEPAIEAVEPAQVTIESLGQTVTGQSATSQPTEPTEPLFEIETPAEPDTLAGNAEPADQVQTVAQQPNPFLVDEQAEPLFEIDTHSAEQNAPAEIVQTSATEPNPFALVEPAEYTAPGQNGTAHVRHAERLVQEGCAGPECELIGRAPQPAPAPGADQTSQPK